MVPQDERFGAKAGFLRIFVLKWAIRDGGKGPYGEFFENFPKILRFIVNSCTGSFAMSLKALKGCAVRL